MFEADMSDNGPKEISISCSQGADVRIVDLHDEERDLAECMVLNINTPDLSSRLVLYCDGSTRATGFDGEGEHGDGGSDDSSGEDGTG